MSAHYECDRCGLELSTDTSARAARHVPIAFDVSKAENGPGGYSKANLDLCGKCVTSYNEWFDKWKDKS